MEADIILYKAALDYLIEKGDGPISSQNRLFLQMTYADGISETVSLIHGANLPPADKLSKYRAIAVHPLTQTTYQECVCEEASQSRSTLLQAAMLAGSALEGERNEDLRVVTQTLAPHCGQVLCAETLPLFLADKGLLQALIQDEPEAMLQNLLLRIGQAKDKDCNTIAAAIQVLAVNHPLLYQISEANFLRSYTQLYLVVWREETLPALDEMTGLLLENQVTDGKETFLKLYISLAALENQAPAFVFGKFQLAWFLLEQGRKEECRAVAEELMELGVENEELSALYQKLN